MPTLRTLLEMVFLLQEVRSWFRNIGKRLVKTLKVFLTDTKLLCHAWGRFKKCPSFGSNPVW